MKSGWKEKNDLKLLAHFSAVPGGERKTAPPRDRLLFLGNLVYASRFCVFTCSSPQFRVSLELGLFLFFFYFK